jgi:hypothetical protein
MSFKAALFKAVGTTALVGIGAALAKKQQATGGSGGGLRKSKKGCTPCAAMAMVDTARQSAKTGQL